MVSQPDKVIQRQPLGKFTEFIAFFRANQRIEPRPVLHLLRGERDLLLQRLLALLVLGVLLQLLADLP